jgi:hypothetical protein
VTFDLKPCHRSAALGATAYAFSIFRAKERVARGNVLVKEPLGIADPHGAAD